VYFLEKKSEAFETFKKFKVMVEKMTGKKIWSLRSDRGGEYMSNQFMSYYENHGICRFLIAPYTPQQNGVAERNNRTILDMVRIMIKTKEMPKEFWAETVQCAVTYRIDARMRFLITLPLRTLERTQTQRCTFQRIREHSIRKNSKTEENQARR
jgi:transposase InsO family protein